MAVDVAISDGGHVRNARILVMCLPTGPVALARDDRQEIAGPTDAELLAKYGDRFDDPRYYTGDTA